MFAPMLNFIGYILGVKVETISLDQLKLELGDDYREMNND